jgi:FkbM family methyltransferase
LTPEQQFAKSISLQIEKGRVHEDDYWIFGSFCRAGDTAVDIGANSGQSIISIRTVNCVANIVSFEPNPFLADILQRLKNYYSDLEIYMLGLGDSDEERDLYIPVVDGLLITPPEQKQYIQQLGTRPDVYLLRETIRTVRGDNLGLTPSLMKIDAEGFELNIVRGLVNTISQYRPLLMIEKSRFISEIDSFLTGMGYARYRYVKEKNMLILLPPITQGCEQSQEVPLNVFFAHEHQLLDLRSRGIRVS